MKFRYLFSAIAASLVLLSGCAKEESVGSLDNIKLSDTFLSIDAKGGSVDLTIDATEDWAFQTIDKIWPEVVSEKDGQEVRTPSWLSVNKMSGTSGQTKVTFSAEATETGRELSLSIKVGTSMQFLKVRQGSLDPVALTCKDIEDGKVTVGANYKMAGTVVQLGNYASYGAFYINDGTSTKNAQIYKSTDESKAAFPNVEVGDYVEFSGTWSSYGNFEGAEISKLKKALVKVITKTVNVSEKGGEIEIKVAYKGSGVYFDEPESDWVSYVGMSFKEGVPDKLISNPADTALVKYSISPNKGENKRSFTLDFSSYSGKDSSEDTAEIVQAGAHVPSSIAELNASITTESPTESNFKANLKDAVISYANGASAFIEDATGGTIYFNWDKKLEAGKKINGVVTGKAYLYNGFVEIVDIDLSQAIVENIEGGVSPTGLTIKELLENYSRWQHCYVKLENVTFTTAITPNNRNGKISQGDSEIAVYAQVKNKLDMSGTGDLVCLPTSFKGKPQVGVYDNSQFAKK